MGGKGGDDGGYAQNAQQNSGPVVARMATDAGMQPAPAPVADTPAPVPVTPAPTTPTQGDDAKTPGGDNTATPGSGASGGSGTDTGAVAAQTLAAPSYWFNQPISTLAPKPIMKKGSSMKKTNTGGSV
jgi:hypothetical protein